MTQPLPFVFLSVAAVLFAQACSSDAKNDDQATVPINEGADNMQDPQLSASPSAAAGPTEEIDSSDPGVTLMAPVQHRSAAQIETLSYTSGMGLVISGDFRNLEVESGASGEVQVVYSAVVDLAEGRTDSQVATTLAELEVTVTVTSSGVMLAANRSGDSNVAAVLEVRIPSEFDGDVSIEQGIAKNQGGEVEIGTLGGAKNLSVDLNSSSTDFIARDVTDLESALVSVNGFSQLMTGSFAAATFQGASLSAESGDITTSFAVVPSQFDVQVLSDQGDVQIGLPGAGDYTMQAASSNFTFETAVPAACTSAQNAAGASLTCGAGSDMVNFRLTAGGALEVDHFLSL